MSITAAFAVLTALGLGDVIPFVATAYVAWYLYHKFKR